MSERTVPSVNPATNTGANGRSVVRAAVLPVISYFSPSDTQKIFLNIRIISICTGTTGVQAAAECVQADDLLMDVMAGMFNDRKSCMGVMHDGSLVGNISISDLRAFSPDIHAHLLQPVGKYLMAIKGLSVPQVCSSHVSTRPMPLACLVVPSGGVSLKYKITRKFVAYYYLRCTHHTETGQSGP